MVHIDPNGTQAALPVLAVVHSIVRDACQTAEQAALNARHISTVSCLLFHKSPYTNLTTLEVLLSNQSCWCGAELLENLLAEENVMDVVGALEYDPELAARQNHRQFLREHVIFKEVRSPALYLVPCK